MLPLLLALVRFAAACLLGRLSVLEGIDVFDVAMQAIDRASRCRLWFSCDFCEGIQSVLILPSQRFGFIPAYPGAPILFGTLLILVWILLHMIITALLLVLLAAAAGMIAAADGLDDLKAGASGLRSGKARSPRALLDLLVVLKVSSP